MFSIFGITRPNNDNQFKKLPNGLVIRSLRGKWRRGHDYLIETGLHHQIPETLGVKYPANIEINNYLYYNISFKVEGSISSVVEIDVPSIVMNDVFTLTLSVDMSRCYAKSSTNDMTIPIPGSVIIDGQVNAASIAIDSGKVVIRTIGPIWSQMDSMFITLIFTENNAQFEINNGRGPDPNR